MKFPKLPTVLETMLVEVASAVLSNPELFSGCL